MKEDHHGEIYRTHKAMETVSSHVQLYRNRAGQGRTEQDRTGQDIGRAGAGQNIVE